ncbi:MAG: efflux RND transporter permease subunit [Gammaproteobacteria bacterium]|nr:efflux RND transporter permease subunit [Gammaproteobacteria bacterium]
MSERLGISGSLARRFLRSEITPLLALVGVLLGAFAVAVTPREEEPQIQVTFANVFIPFPGASPREVEELVTASAEQVLSELEGVKHIYSISRRDMATLSVEFEVGENRTEAIVRLYNAIYSNSDWLPANAGIGQPVIKPRGIDDVPIVTLTLWTEDESRGGHDLKKVAHALEAELKRVPGTRDIETIGGPDTVVRVLLDPQRLAAHGLEVADLRRTLEGANVAAQAGSLVSENGEIAVQAGDFLSEPQEIGDLVVAAHQGRPVSLRDVAEIRFGAAPPRQYVWMGTGPAADDKQIGVRGEFPAVTLAVAKKPGTNAVEIAEQVIARFEALKGTFVPQGIQATVTRNYGETADQKARKLITKLVFATLSVVLLVLFTLGWREALVVGIAVTVTLAITLFASWAWGFTLNRVSLFALIFSIGILVDDAIVIVENIHRHMQMGKQSFLEAIPVAVDEVGGPTILATFTVIAALLPMAFVTGLMGPYMSPIPINASMGMLISLLVALIVTPWLAYRLLHRGSHSSSPGRVDDRLRGVFEKLMRPFLRGSDGRRARWLLAGGLAVLIVISVGLVAGKLVVLKMLPFDNKSEFQVVVDLPEGTSLEETARVLADLGRQLAEVPEVTDYEVYAGTASPINFNGLVRQYHLRSGSHLGDIQVNLADKHRRQRSSHEIARSVRAPLQQIARRFGANVKIVEVPPGPPVFAPLVAEIYGLDYAGQIGVAQKVREVFSSTADIVDVDDSIEAAAPRWIVRVDRRKAALHGISQQAVVSTLTAALAGDDVGYLHRDNAKYAVPIRLQLPLAAQADLRQALALKVRAADGSLVAISEFADLEKTTIEHSIYHKDLLPVVFVTGDMAGELDSPLYGMGSISARLDEAGVAGAAGIEQYWIEPPGNPYQYGLKWDGEWQITYETFRDMGIAYSVGLILIYLLVVGQFRSYLVPLIIMIPIPLTVIGVMPGHALLGATFTATSMIGMIALAGIIVRNSILLVDFINDELRQGTPFDEAVLRSGVARTKPILLTALAAILGALFILDDPIFSGLAVALIFGLLVSTLLTLVVIPVMYYAFMAKRVAVGADESA